MSHTFIPANLELGADRRSLSILLKSIDLPPPTLTPLTLFLFLAIAVVTGLATYRMPSSALAWIIVTAPIAAFVVIGPVTLTVPQLILIGCGAGLFARTRLRIFLPGRMTLLFLGLQTLMFALAVLSTVGAQYKTPAILELWKSIQYIATFAVAYAACRIKSQDPFAGSSLAGMLLIVCVLAAAQEFTGAPSSEFMFGHVLPRIAGPLDGPNQLGGFLGLAIPVLAAFAFTKRKAYVLWLVVGGACTVLALTLSRGSLIGLVVAATVLLIFRYRPAFLRIAVFSLSGLFVIFLLATLLQSAGVGLYSHPVQSTFNGGLGSRTTLWHDAITLWRTSPLLGVGPGNFEYRLAQIGEMGVRTHANSAYLQSLAETGVLGFFCLLAITAAPIRALAAQRENLVIAGILAAALGLAFHQVIDVLTFYPKIGVLFWALLGWGYSLADCSTVPAFQPTGPSVGTGFTSRAESR